MYEKGILTQTNTKGQIVIHGEYRKALGLKNSQPINVVLENDHITLWPVKDILVDYDTSSSYTDILKNTQGKWGSYNSSTKKRQLELDSSQKRRLKW